MECTSFIHSSLDNYPMKPAPFRVFCTILRRGECSESVDNMAHRLHLHPKTVRLALRFLVARGLLTRQDRPGSTSVYRATAPETWGIDPLPKGTALAKKGSPQKVQPSLTDTPLPLPNDRGEGGTNDTGHPSPNDTDEGTPIKVLPLRDMHPPLNEVGHKMGRGTAAHGDHLKRHEAIRSTWNSTPGVIPCKQISYARGQAIDYCMENAWWAAHWPEAMACITQPTFFKGKGGDWRPSLDWFLKPDTALKLIEGDFQTKAPYGHDKRTGRSAGTANEAIVHGSSDNSGDVLDGIDVAQLPR